MLRSPCRPATALAVLAAMAQAPAAAQSESGTTASPWSFGITAAAATFGDAKLDGGGKVQLTPYGVSLSASYTPRPDASVGVGLASTEYRFSFPGSGTVATLDPWSDVNLTTLSLPLRWGFGPQWSMSFVPSYQVARASGAASGDSGRYGGVLALSYVQSPRHLVGIGASYFTGLDDDTFFPIVVVDWQLDEDWRLSNPLTAGPTGPAGLELVRRLGRGWEAGFGAAYRTLRFRLDEGTGPAPGGTGSYSGVIAFGRVQYRFNAELSLSLYLGGEFDGKLEIDAKGGRTLISEGVGSAPMVGLSASGRF